MPEEKYAGKFDVKAFAAKHNLKPQPIGAADYKTRKEEQLNLSGLGLWYFIGLIKVTTKN